ncbi:processive 1,2-diacylglycerol beta-glucosyltransferase [Desulfohalotomaculum tongense]|uniref:MGDG synthase family glycosyltransferase n=1 Tax=Desulforadius tongensis TaxID=1216062 RepID=UPI00195AD437|nr:glycosyltransferase [Desulforadius tongensis]MBM7854433.1 processive 1,2-diacylglycerol beta-glucosyltransferase [Desulforadius tongensis]
MSSGNALKSNPAVHRELNKVLMLTVSAGDGHTRAAEAVKKQFLTLFPAARVSIVDTFRYASPLVEKMVLGAYLEIIKLSPMVYRYLYYKAEKTQPLSGFAKMEFNRIINKLAAPKLVSLINSFQPQVILCTHPFPLGIISSLKLDGKLDVPVLATITDFAVHPFWIYPGVDCYCVASQELKLSFARYGVDDSKVVVTGIPIDPVFNNVEKKELLKKRLQLSADLPAVLVSGGGLGMGPLEEVVKALGSRQCQLLVVCGRNESLKGKIENLAGRLKGQVQVYGFVDNIHELMGAADLMVSKAGGLTCSEAMAVGLPLFITAPIPGQEERNTEYLVKQGAAIAIKDSRHLLDEFDRCFTEPQLIAGMARKAKKIGCPNSSYQVVSLIQQIYEKKYPAAGGAVVE